MVFMIQFVIIITFTLVFGYIILSSTETISNKAWSVSKSASFKSDDKTIETHPRTEAFKGLSNNRKKSLSIRSSESQRLKVINPISPLYNISSTTCKTMTMETTKKHTSTSTVDQPSGLLKDSNYDTDVESFLKVDDEELTKQLINIEVTIDGSGDTSEPTSVTTPVSITIELTSTLSSKPTESTSTTTITIRTSTTRPQLINLSPHSIFIITINCQNATDILDELLKRFNRTFTSWYNVSYNHSILQCTRSVNIDMTLDFITDNSITVLNNLFKTLASVALDMHIDLRSVSRCDDGQIVSVTNVTSCYLINLCDLCGRTPPRGVCDPDSGLSECRCFVNQNDSSMPYVGELCLPKKTEPILMASSRETTIIVGVLAGVAGLFCSLTFCLLARIFWHRHGRRIYSHNQNKRRVSPEWHSSPATVPTSITTENTSNSSKNILSTSSSHRKKKSNKSKSGTTNRAFPKDSNQKRSANLHTSKTNAKLPEDTISITNSYDPINELDPIIDNIDTTTVCHDPLDDLFDGDEMLTVTKTKS